MFLKAVVKVVLTFAATASIPRTAAMIESYPLGGICRHLFEFADGRCTYIEPEAAMAQQGFKFGDASNQESWRIDARRCRPCFVSIGLDSSGPAC